MCRWMTQRGVTGQIGLIEQLACPLRRKRHHTLEIRQAGDRAQLAQIDDLSLDDVRVTGQEIIDFLNTGFHRREHP